MSDEDSNLIDKKDTQEEPEKGIPTSHGRTPISDRRREGSYSKRAANGSLDVIKKLCPSCGHHKAFSGIGSMRCTRCKKEIKL